MDSSQLQRQTRAASRQLLEETGPFFFLPIVHLSDAELSSTLKKKKNIGWNEILNLKKCALIWSLWLYHHKYIFTDFLWVVYVICYSTPR